MNSLMLASAIKNFQDFPKHSMIWKLFKLNIKIRGHCVQSPHVHLVANFPPTRKHILFLNKNISLIREYYMNVNTQGIFFTIVLILQAKKYHYFSIVLSKTCTSLNRINWPLFKPKFSHGPNLEFIKVNSEYVYLTEEEMICSSSSIFQFAHFSKIVLNLYNKTCSSLTKSVHSLDCLFLTMNFQTD